MDFNMPLYEPVAGSGGEKINTAGKTVGNFRKAISIRNFNHRYIKKRKKKKREKKRKEKERCAA